MCGVHSTVHSMAIVVHNVDMLCNWFEIKKKFSPTEFLKLFCCNVFPLSNELLLSFVKLVMFAFRLCRRMSFAIFSHVSFILMIWCLWKVIDICNNNVGFLWFSIVYSSNLSSTYNISTCCENYTPQHITYKSTSIHGT